MNRAVTLVLGTIAVAAALVGGWYWWQQKQIPPPPPVVQAPAPPAVATTPPEPPPILHPVDQAALALGTSLPADVTLDHSDASLREALATAFPDRELPAFLHVDRIIRNVVATVDALPREKVSPTVMPVEPVPGRFIVTTGDSLAIAPENAARYSLYVNLLQAVNTRLLAGVYLHYYPLFQQAYRELGYPNGYFNDRLVEVIDLLLKTPDVAGPVALSQPKVLYLYADPALEALPGGQKILLRMGPDNAAVVKAKLRDFRALIVRDAPAKQ
jgi:hypothetical protein